MKLRKHVLIILFYFPLCLSAQSSLLTPVTPIAQKASNWCWAASLEMVLKYHQPTSVVTQCSLAIYNINDSGWGIKVCCSDSKCPACQSSTCSNCIMCMTCTECHVLQMKTHADCNQVMSGSTMNKSLIKYSKLIKKIGFRASYINGRLPIMTIENEINICKRPLITIYNGFTHAATVIGTTKPSTDYFIRIFNPKDAPCVVAQDDINYDVPNPERPDAFMYNIYPENLQNPCIATPLMAGLRMRALKMKTMTPDSFSNNTTIENGIYKRLSNDELQKKIDSKDYYPIVVRYISSNKLKQIPENELGIANTTIQNDMIELVSEKYPRTVTVFQRQHNVWIPIKISPFYKDNILPVSFNDSTVVLNNRDKNLKILCNNRTYEHIKYFDLGYDFYRFCLNGTYYLIPFYDYEDFKNLYFVNNKDEIPISNRIYLQSDILKLLKKRTL